MTHSITLGLGLFILWFLLSGYTIPLILAFGVFSCALCVWLARRMDITDDETVPIRVRPRISGYWGWLGREIVKANWQVVKIILRPRLNLSQQLIDVPATQTTDMGRVIFANSITLTPGTVTVETESGHFLVHAIEDQFADQDALSDMDRRVTAVENRK